MVYNTVKKRISKEIQKEEKKCLDYLQLHQPNLVPDYLNALKKGRKRVLNKLAGALLREDIVSLYSKSIKLKKVGSVFVMSLEDVDENWELLIRQLPESSLRENLTYFVFYFDERLLVFPVKKEYGFRRVILTDDILLISKEKMEVVETASDLLASLGDMLPDQASTLKKELDNGTANYILALSDYEQWKRELCEEAEKLNTDTSIQYALSKKRSNPLWSSSLFFEQFSTEGHNLHPGSKTKEGLEPGDVFSFSPEFRQSLLIYFLAIRKDYLVSTEFHPDYIESKFPETAKLYEVQMKERGYKVKDYRLIPVHEWQYHNVIPSLYAEEIKMGIIVLFTGLAIEGAASSSFRTIWPKLFGKPALKLAVNSQMTSTIRSISPQTAMNSVEFSVMMQTIMEREPSLENFLPINEVAGYSFRSESIERSRNLTVVVRENFDSKLNPGEIAIPGCSLYNLSPISGKNLIAEIADEYCRYFNFNKAKGTDSFLTEYLSVVIPGYLILLVKYGVALEGHLQNSVPVFKNGKLVRFYFRDWGGARIYENRLNQQGIKIDFYPDSVSITSDEQKMREKAFYTVFQNHLGEIIMQLCEYSGTQEKSLWKKVREACDKVFSELHTQGVEGVSRDAASLFEPWARHKALTSMRLYPKSGYCYSTVPNPLATECE
ncbi:hypothetical protein A1A1_12117 [Planococcus antarcticus DSM 14505]|uniref:IucA/IucC family siderophore biosynthesis protein n=1 Tax=Planococcus antarcticus DSM 14505 TaxID=1185653 RepID=A0A1C7DDM8_9BACL|nr:IucA/IucC family protein [Planococcus antarcticus]ANU09527.1 hypothetical protein BBH88_04000 [Planococcus antarcticus DSM 14505]EIM06308.1 hypothetical protein A1A1_12117 [Planococcus antarcticus DSM 14505]